MLVTAAADMRGIGRSLERLFEKIVHLDQAGVPPNEIARLCMCSKRTIIKTIKRVQRGGSFLPPKNTGKLYANRRFTPELLRLLEEYVLQGEDFFIDEARDHLQRFSVPPIRDEVVRRELRRLGYTNKKVRQQQGMIPWSAVIDRWLHAVWPCPFATSELTDFSFLKSFLFNAVPCRRTATARREILQRRLITVTSAEGSSRGLSWSL